MGEDADEMASERSSVSAGVDEDPDEVIEIDEGVLRQELARLRRINESRRRRSLAENKGHVSQHGDPAAMAKDFGGGSVLRDAFDFTDKDINVYAENRKLKTQLKKIGTSNKALKNQLAEYVKAVKALKNQLQEMNLFNAKLLYANKLFQNKNISNAKMRSIVESIDAAKSLREVKLLYRTLTESLGKQASLNESQTRRTLGGASRPAKSSSATKINEGAEVARWARLAGLNK